MNNYNYKDVFNYKIFKNLEITGIYNEPVIRPVNLTPTKVISFNHCLSCKNPQDYFVHFYIDDYQFERIWNKPEVYADILKKFAGVIGPDFSAYTNLPLIQQMFNLYRNKALTAYYQKLGINVIPNARWFNDKGLFRFNNGLNGLPKHSTIAITTHNCINSQGYAIFRIEFNDILEKLEPTRIICIGKMPQEQFEICKKKNIEILIFQSELEILENKGGEINGKREKSK